MTLDDLQSAMDALDPEAQPRAEIFTRAAGAGGPKPNALGVLDASFNPPTKAHLQLALRAREELGLAEVLLLLSNANVDKAVTGATLGQRLEMMLLVSEAADFLSVGGCSHARFVDKATALAPHYPAGADITFILGFDTLTRLFDPKYYVDMESDLASLFERCRIAAANRGDVGAADVRNWLDRPEVQPFGDRIAVFTIDPVAAAMSSTRVRERVGQGRSITDLVPVSVAAYIERADIYGQA